MQSPTSSSRRSTRALLGLLGLLLAVTPSCKLFNTAVTAPGNVLGGKEEKPVEKIPLSALQIEMMRFADTFAARITQGTREFEEKAATPEAQIQALTWSIGQNTSAFTIATGNNANIALLDMVFLVSLGRMTHEEYWIPKVWGEADRPMLTAFQELETQIWSVASQRLDQAQQDELHKALIDWRERNPDMGATAFVRLPAFADVIKASAVPGETKKGGLGEMLTIDPLSGLDPAVREIEHARLLAERTVFYLQRTPIILSSQVELLVLKLARMPQVGSVLADSQRISLAAASISETAAKLPESVRAEREAAVKQISDELTQQRQGLVADLEKSEAPVSKLLTETRATLEAGTKLTAALQGTIGTVDTFLNRFEKKDDGQKPEAAAQPAAPAKPFDINEYGDAASKVGTAVREMNGLVGSLDQSLPKVQNMIDEAARTGDQTIDHAFTRGLQLGIALIVAAVLAVLVSRWISARFLGTKTRQALG